MKVLTNDPEAQFHDEVFPEELREIADRRDATGCGSPVRKPAAASDAPQRPSTRLGLVGLAFSGGGIRSATFCLGVLQALAAQRVLPKVDYLSTVSGGGFIGSCLSSLLNNRDKAPKKDEFPLRGLDDGKESLPTQHLRNSGSYLAPSGFMDKLRLCALLARGLLNNALVFLPLIMVAVMVTEAVYQLSDGDLLKRAVWVAYGIIGLLLLSLITFPLAARWVRWMEWKWRDGYERLLGVMLLLTFLALASCLFLTIVGDAISIYPEEMWTAVEHRLAQLREHHGWLWLVVPAILLLLAVLAGFSEKLAQLRKRAMLFGMGISMPLMFLGIYFWLFVYPSE